MSKTLKTIVTAQIDAVYKNVLDLGTPTDNFLKKTKIELTSGTAADKADLMFSDQRTLAASGTEDLDLAGSLSDAFGATLTFVELKAIIVSAASGNTNNVLVARASSNGVPLFSAASDAIPVYPGGVFMWANPGDGGVTVTAGSGDLITITNSSSGTSVTYDVVIIGTSA